jgi:hypothetical protein
MFSMTGRARRRTVAITVFGDHLPTGNGRGRGGWQGGHKQPASGGEGQSHRRRKRSYFCSVVFR